MDIYLTSLALGAVGLAAMAIGGSGRHSNSHSHGDGGHAIGHGGHGGHGHAAHAGHAGHDAHVGHVPAVQGRESIGNHHYGSDPGQSQGFADGATNLLLTLMSPRVLFSIALGLGASGLVAKPLFGSGILLFTVALGGGILFERLIVTPLWNLGFKFESSPALTLESAVSGEATVVSTFDKNGQGLISVEVDGQVMQVLGTLHPDSRALAGRVGVGTRVRIDDVDAARNRCTVSLL